MNTTFICVLCFGECQDDGNSIEIMVNEPGAKAFVCASCIKAEPGLIAHIGKVKSE